MGVVSGSGGAKTINVAAGAKLVVSDFGAFGTGDLPTTPGELDTLRFLDPAMTASNMLLTQQGADVLVTFEGLPGTHVRLQATTVEQLENIAGAGNFQFFGDAAVRESIDVWSAWQVSGHVAHNNGTTVLNDQGNTVIGRDGSDDTIDGQGGDDVLFGRGGNDLLRGGIGDDLLNGGKGADHMIGGAGNDVYVVDDAGDVVSEDSGGGTDTVRASIDYTLGANIENLTLTGSVGLQGTGNNGDNAIHGSTGNDTLVGEAGDDTLDGGAGADIMVGGRGNDTYYVDNPGDQVIETIAKGPGGGIDLVVSSIDYVLGANLDNLQLSGHAVSGTGNALDNVISGNGRGNTLSGLGGDDTILGGAGHDHLVGGSGNDSLSGGGGGDFLDGGDGNDVLDGGAGRDVMRGGAGDDHYLADNIGDKVFEEAGGGIDLVTATVDFKLSANVENLELVATGITGTGNALGNTITTAYGSCTLDGRGGDDVLIGGTAPGSILLGGDGNDVLVLRYNDAHLIDGGAGVDTLNLDRAGGTLDFSGELGTEIKNVEIVDLSGGTANHLILNPAIVDGLGGSNGSAFGDHTLLVKGDSGDTVSLDGIWAAAGTVSDPFGQIGTFSRFTSGEATLLVASDLAVDIRTAAIPTLGSLDGSNGFRIDDAGFGATMNQPWLANLGDVNGDGYTDLLLGDPDRSFGSGGGAVVFGHTGAFPSVLNVDTMSATDGFRIDGTGGHFGESVSSAGDINGDGYADLIIGAPDTANGSATVIFGHAGGFGSDFSSPLDGGNGFQISGAAPQDQAGRSVASIGDINGDGYADILIGAPGADPNGVAVAGSAYVIFGHGGAFDPSIDLAGLDGSKGFRLDGASPGGEAGYAVAGAGDVNGDGYADYLVAGTNTTAVVFGHGGSFAPTLDLGKLDGSNGFVVAGGRSVSSAGDINGDGFDDLIIGDSGAVVFGHPGAFAPSVTAAALDGANGFSILQAGATVSAAGDINGDGYADFLVSHPLANGPAGVHAGETFVVFGHAGPFTSQLDLTKLDPTQGFRLDGVNAGDYSGGAVSAAGDLNGDGFDDLVVGAPGAQPDGSGYVIFGGKYAGPANYVNGTFGTASDDTMVGGVGNDTFNGNGGADSFSGGAGDDQFYVDGPVFRNIDGGPGYDTAELDNMGPLIDLTGDLRGRMTSVEDIWLAGFNDNTLKLDTAAVEALVGGEITPNGANTLKIDAGSNDTVVFSGDWTTSAIRRATPSWSMDR